MIESSPTYKQDNRFGDFKPNPPTNITQQLYGTIWKSILFFVFLYNCFFSIIAGLFDWPEF
jgi:hypothetical protein